MQAISIQARSEIPNSKRVTCDVMILKADWGVIIHFANVCPRLFWHSKLKVALVEATLRVHTVLSDPCVINARLTFLCKVMVWRKAPVHK